MRGKRGESIRWRRSFRRNWEWARRLKSLGVVKGTRLLLLTKKKGGTAAVKIRGTRLALGRKLAEAIEILPLEEPAAEWKERRRQTVEESE